MGHRLYPSFVRANQSAEHALNDQFLGRNQVGIFRVFSPQKWLAALDEIPLERGFAVNQCRHDVAASRLAKLHDYHIAFHNGRVFHRVAPHLEGKCPGISWKMDGIRINRNAAVAFLLLVRRMASGNRSKDGDVDKTRLPAWQNDVARFPRFPLDCTLLFKQVKVS